MLKRRYFGIYFKIVLCLLFALISASAVFLHSLNGNLHIKADNSLNSTLTDEALEIERGIFATAKNEVLGELETVLIDRDDMLHSSPIIEKPNDTVYSVGVPEPDGAARPTSYSGPFAVNDTRPMYVYGPYSGKSSHFSVTSKLVAQGSHGNIWVPDDASWHTATGTTHSSSCYHDKMTVALATEIATAFDKIYLAMTNSSTGLAPHSNVIVPMPYSNLTQMGDLGKDSKVNVFFHAMTMGGYFWSADYFNTYTQLDVIHIDFSSYGYSGLTGSADSKLGIFGTLAHEFQHLLYNTYFGSYFSGSTASASGDDSWFNETLSGLADAYYTKAGAELVGHFNASVQNEYSGGTYSDFFNYIGSKSYGMGYNAAKMLHKKYANFINKVYKHFIATYPPTTAYDTNLAKITNHKVALGNAIYAATSIGSGGADSFEKFYFLFMENFASDGGTVHGSSSWKTTKIITATEPMYNLWAIRTALGKYDDRVYTDFTLSSFYRGSGFGNAFPTISSGGAISLKGYGTTPAVGATHEKMHLLSGVGNEPTSKITITAPNDGKAGTRYYLVLANDPTIQQSSSRYSLGTNGADLYPLTKGTSFTTNTLGKTAYLYVVTLYQNVSSTITFSVEDVRPSITSISISGATTFGSTLTAVVNYSKAVTDPDVTYAWRYQDTAGTWSLGSAKTLKVPSSTVGYKIMLEVRSNNTNVLGGVFNATSDTITETRPKIESVKIKGTVAYGEKLTAEVTFSAPIANPDIGYTWVYSKDNVGWSVLGEGTTLTVPMKAIGHYLELRITSLGTNVQFGQYSAIGGIIADNRAKIESVQIIGDYITGSLLTAKVNYSSQIENPDIVFEWMVFSDNKWWTIAGSGNNPTFSIPSASNSSYYIGKKIRVVVKSNNTNVSDGTFYAETDTLKDDRPSLESVEISGDAVVGSVLTASAIFSNQIQNPDVVYSWEASLNRITWTNLSSLPTYTIKPNDADHYIRVKATANGTNVQVGTVISTETKKVADNRPSILSISIDGNAFPNETLTAVITYSEAIESPDVYIEWRLIVDNEAWRPDFVSSSNTYSLSWHEVGYNIELYVRSNNSNVKSYEGTVFVAITDPRPVIESVEVLGNWQVGESLTADITFSRPIDNPEVEIKWYLLDSKGNETLVSSQKTILLLPQYVDRTLKLSITSLNTNVQAYTYNTSNQVVPNPKVYKLDVTASAIVFGQSLSMSDLTIESDVEGVAVWTEPNTIPNVLNHGFMVLFTPSDSRLEPREILVPISVLKALPFYSVPTVMDMTYLSGLMLWDVELPEGWSWNCDDALLFVGDHCFEAIFTPTDTDNYLTVLHALEFKVLKSEPFYTLPVILDIPYFSNLTLNDIDLPDGWAWVEPSTVLFVGNNTCEAVFTPLDTLNFEVVVAAITFKVLKGEYYPDIPTLDKVTYFVGITLKDVSLSDGWTWASPDTLLNAGSHIFTAKYTPSDSFFNEAFYHLDVVVLKAIPVVATPILQNIVFSEGLILRDVTLLEGWAWSEQLTVLNAGTHSFVASYTHTDSINFEKVFRTISFTVLKADPSPLMPKLESLAYSIGLTLNDVALVKGWRWSNPETLLKAGTKSYSAVFTPSDEQNYNTITKSFDVTVLKADFIPAVIPTISDFVFFEGTLKDVSLPINWAWEKPSQAISAGANSHRIIHTHLDQSFNTYSHTVSFLVEKATPVVPTLAAVTFSVGMSISSFALPSGWDWDAPDISTLSAGTHSFMATYTPTDGNYTPRTAMITIVIDKAEPIIPQMEAKIDYVKDASISSVTLPVGWRWADPNTALKIGTHKYLILFDGDQNHNSKESYITITIKRPFPWLVLGIILGSVTLLALIVVVIVLLAKKYSNKRAVNAIFNSLQSQGQYSYSQQQVQLQQQQAKLQQQQAAYAAYIQAQQQAHTQAYLQQELQRQQIFNRYKDSLRGMNKN